MHELEGMARSMTVGPLPSDQVARLLRSYQEVAKEQAEVKAQLVKPAPAWAEFRECSTSSTACSSPDAPDRQTGRVSYQVRRRS